LSLLQQWLKREGYMVFFSEWNSSLLIKDTTRRGKAKHMLTPTTFSLIHATDLADRIERHIIPPLKAGAIVLADRFIYTAFARDVVRGVSPRWVRDLYRFAVKPTIAFYFRVPLEISLKRILGARAGLKYYEAGMDLYLSEDIEDSFKIFQSRIRDQYESMIEEFGLTVIDATRPIEEQQYEVRALVERELRDVPKRPNGNNGWEDD
jgi:dTMP kinase